MREISRGKVKLCEALNGNALGIRASMDTLLPSCPYPRSGLKHALVISKKRRSARASGLRSVARRV